MNLIQLPYITILMPIYNGIEFLPISLLSILQQQDVHPKVWELIIGINGHPANSTVYQQARHIVNECIKLHNTKSNPSPSPSHFQIKIVDLYDLAIKGKSSALNEMVSKYTHPKSQWIALFDVDDVWHPLKLKTQFPLLLFGKYDVVGTRCIYFGDKKEKNGTSPDIPLGDLIHYNFLHENPMINSSVIIKRKYALWNPTEDGVEDYDLWLSLKQKGMRFYNCPEKYVKHRLHSESAYNSAKGNNHNKVEKLKKKYM